MLEVLIVNGCISIYGNFQLKNLENSFFQVKNIIDLYWYFRFRTKRSLLNLFFLTSVFPFSLAKNLACEGHWIIELEDHRIILYTHNIFELQYNHYYLQYDWKNIYTSVLSCVQLFVTQRTAALQASLSMEFSRQEFWSGMPFPPPGDLPHPGIEPASPVSRTPPTLAGNFFTSDSPKKTVLIFPAIFVL